MAKQKTCAELVDLVKAKGPEALDGMDWLGEIVDIDGAVAFTGLTRHAITRYHGVARRTRAALAAMTPKERKAATPRWLWPEPDLTLAGHPGWSLRTIVLARSSMPGSGAGGGRPWPKKPASASSSAKS